VFVYFIIFIFNPAFGLQLSLINWVVFVFVNALEPGQQHTWPVLNQLPKEQHLNKLGLWQGRQKD